MADSVYWIWLQILFGIGTRRAELLMEYFDHPQKIYNCCVQKGDGSAVLADSERAGCEQAMAQAQDIHRRTEKKGCHIVTPDHPHYPPLLGGLFDKPAALYVIGDLSCLEDSLAIAMVGTRNHTQYGKKAAAYLAEELARSGVVVVSGLAQGIDAESHRAALAGGGKTIGILGCGIDVDYPKGSREIKTAMRDSGAVVTEYPLGYPPMPENFPLRNRLISGISNGTVVVEADKKSGSLITARLAREQGREVFAVPGPIFSRGGMGTHQLIKEGATLVDDIDDILACYPRYAAKQGRKGRPHIPPSAGPDPLPDDAPEVQRPIPVKKPKRRPLPEGISEIGAQVYQSFGQETLTVDDLAGFTGIATGELLGALTELELLGLLQCYPGRRFGLIE